ncbi:MAG TPA: hypothetical protein VMD02_03165, partial [Candidatus Omnitrophota bacterium]|nr:hypothetical protein [Candidatus Omnitrophota bacterium]
YWLPAAFSFFIVGLGQLVKGDSEKGIKFLLMFYFALPAVIYFSLMVSGAIFLAVFGISTIFAVIFWAYNIFDALKARA